MYELRTTPGHAPNKTTDGVLGDLFKDLDQGISELLDSLWRDSAKLDAPIQNNLEVFN